MTLNSVFFFALFFSFLPLFYISKKFKWLFLLIFNYYFYLLAMPKHLLTIFTTSIVCYIFAIIIHKTTKKSLKKLFLVLSIFLFISALVYFKYFSFFESLFFSANSKDLNTLVAPIGISFYTLQIISYLIDVYNNKFPAEKHLGYFMCYVSFFGTILSGPIERASNFIPQIKKIQSLDWNLAFDGLLLVIKGLFLKIVIADKLSSFVDIVYLTPTKYTGFPLIITTLLFGIQLYTDFNGYSLIAQGFSKMLNINIIQNFDSPYFSLNTVDFWRRWHISLSLWFKDYIYIPLGGNKGSLFRNCLNRLIVFTLSGLWHGANLTFVMWGFLHGFYQSINVIKRNYLGKRKKSAFYTISSIICTYLLINFAWIFFKAQSIKDGFYIAKNLFKGLSFDNLISINNIIPNTYIMLFIFLFIILFFIDYTNYKKLKSTSIFKVVFYIFILILIVLLGNPSQNNFIYFNF